MTSQWFKKRVAKKNLRKYTQRHLRQSRIKSFFSWLRGTSMTNILIFINVVFFFLTFPLLLFEKTLSYVALQPNAFLSLKYPWTIITSMFMHSPGPNILPFLSFHLIINMFVLFSLGNLCEKIIGRKRFLWFYLISGLFAGLMFVFLSGFFGVSGIGERIFGSPFAYAVGASGAIFAIAGLFMILTPKLRFMIIFLPFFSLPAYIMIPLVLFGTWLVSSYAGIGIGNTAHFGGFLAGVVYGFYLRLKYKRKTKMIERYFSR